MKIVPSVSLAALASAILLAPVTTFAQTADTEVVGLVLEHAVEQLRGSERLVDHPVRVDNRVAEAKAGLAWTDRVRDEQSNDSIRAMIRAEPGRFEELLRCPGTNPRECHLLETSIALAASAPAIRESEATIVIHAMFMTHETRQPVHRAAWEYVLERNGGDWKIASVRVLALT